MATAFAFRGGGSLSKSPRQRFLQPAMYDYQRRTLPVDIHEGTPGDFLKRYHVQVDLAVRTDVRSIRHELLSHWHAPESLWVGFEHLRHHGGDAPGPDGIRSGDLSKAQWFELFHHLQSSLQTGTYVPGRVRRIQIPKSSGNGSRPLEIANLIDRVISRAAAQFLLPWVNPGFDDNSFGFRPHRGTRDALIRARQLSLRQGRLLWLAHDFRDAFGKVPRGRLMDLVRNLAPAEMAAVIERLIDTGKKTGIPQGSPISPVLLNIYLDHFVDKPWKAAFPKTPLIRFADDILILCKTPAEARQAEEGLQKLTLPSGMQTKEDFTAAAKDLKRGEEALWLGFQVGYADKTLTLKIADRGWEGLRASLESAQLDENTIRACQASIQGWTEHVGPCFGHEDKNEVVHKIVSTARQCDFDDPPHPRRLREWWLHGWNRWCKKMNEAAQPAS